jgi:hypothetical protein
MIRSTWKDRDGVIALVAGAFDVAVAGAAGKISRNGAQAAPSGGWHLTHPDAPVATGLMQSRTGADQRGQMPVGDQLIQSLPGSGIDVQRHSRWQPPALHDFRDDGDVAVAGFAELPMYAW